MLEMRRRSRSLANLKAMCLELCTLTTQEATNKQRHGVVAATPGSLGHPLPVLPGQDDTSVGQLLFIHTIRRWLYK